MSDFLIQTLLWTGALIALVLLLRRPVARHLGPQTAYALWALPALRLVMPPLVLPAWLAPIPDAAGAPTAWTVTAPTQAPYTADTAPIAPLTGSDLPISAAPAVESSIGVDLALVLLTIWLIGAVVFLVRRFALYHRMRAELLEGSRPVGEACGVRLVETDAIAGPLAFGVFDKVVALPTGFMATRYRRTRDLAIAHELAHHRGRDLLANILVQPLFALHWFNPLGHMGWTAMRRDQEAACDARVVASRDAAERAAYADVIAGFATIARSGPRPALAAPMACPVLGDKSIIHRLRSLTMAEISPRRRFTSRALLLGGALALPLTASISYAETIAQVPEPPAPPSAPAAPSAADVPDAPLPPASPPPPELDEELRQELAEMEQELDEVQDEVAEVQREIVRDGQRQTLVVRRMGRPGESGREVERRVERRVERVGHARDFPMSAQERAEFDRDMAQMRAELARLDSEALRTKVETAMANAPRVVMACPKGQSDIVATRVDADGRETMTVCQTAALSIARASVRAARSAIARDRSLSEEARAEALRSMDEALAEIEAES